MQTIRPAVNQLFCKRKEAETRTKSGIILQQKTVDKPHIAEVINGGSSVKGYQQKDTVIYKPYSTTDIKLEGEEYFLIAEEDVLGTVVEVE